MRQRLVLIASVGLNVALAAVWIVARRHATSIVATDSVAPSAPPAARSPFIPKVVVRKQFFSWQELETTDYPTYIKNLRDIGCPESTIRDIIVADVTQLYVRKRQAEIDAADQQWWRYDPGVHVDKATTAKLQALEQERRSLLATLLGPNWEAPYAPEHPAIVFNGPVLSELSGDVKQAVLDIATRSQQRTLAYTEAQAKAGKTPDPAELARIRQQTRIELSQVLNSVQLEEFLLRYSQSASALRHTLNGFDVTPDEFRSLFRVTDPIEQQMEASYAGDNPATAQQRAALEKQRDDAIRNTLGQDRYFQFRMASDAAFRDAVIAIQQSGAGAGALTALYHINQATAQELTRIRNDASLSAEEKARQLKETQDQQRAAQEELLNQTTPPPPLPPNPPQRIHTYVPGETLEGIANDFGVSPDVIRAANPGIDVNRMSRGLQIKIPQRAQ